MDQATKNVAAPQPRWKVWMFTAAPIVGALLAVAGHLFIR